MKQFVLALVLAFSLGLANQASAADMPLKAPPPPVVEPVSEICWGCILFAGGVIACVLLCHGHHHNNFVPVTNGAPRPI